MGQTLWTRKEGLIGAFLLTVNAHHIWFSQAARYYAWMVFLALLSLLFLVKALRKGRIDLWIGFVLCTVLSVYNHYFAFLVLPAEIIFAVCVISEKWWSYRCETGHDLAIRRPGNLSPRIRQGLIFLDSLALVAVLYLPWVSTPQAQFPKQLQSGSLVPSTPSVQQALSFLGEAIVTYTGARAALLVSWMALGPLGLASSGSRRILLVLLSIGMPFAFLSFAESQHTLRPKCVLFTLPVYLLVVAMGGHMAKVETRHP